MCLKYLIFALFVGVAYAQSTEPSLEDAINSISLNSLPPELQGQVDKEQVEVLKNKSTELFKEKCEKNGGPQAFKNAEAATMEFTKCVSTLVDGPKLQGEIEEAKKNGQVDEVFKRYCDKKPAFQNCFTNLTAAIEPCLNEEERVNIKTVHNITDQLAEFICFKEGDRIALYMQQKFREQIVLFISENGPECITEKQKEIQHCFNVTLGSSFDIAGNGLSVNSMPKIVFGEKECHQYSELQKCVVGALESCSAPTSANIVESLFKFVLKGTPCRNVIEWGPTGRTNDKRVDKKKANSAKGLTVSSLALGALAIAAIF